MDFPINISSYKPIVLNIQNESLTKEQKSQLKYNIQLLRDVIVFFTGVAGAKGLGGHTGGAYDIVPEILIVDGFVKSEVAYPAFFDEAGHRVAIQYLMAALNRELPLEKLLHYREFSEKDPLPGHPEKGMTSGVKFSSGRLGHMWPFVNGIAKAHPNKAVFLFGSDGSQQEGNDAEAARFAVANKLNVNVLVDDNNVTIAGHPNDYLSGYDLEKTLSGHGLKTTVGNPENLDELYSRIRNAIVTKGPVGLVNKRIMALGIEGIEGECEAHDVIAKDVAIKYLKKRGHNDAVKFLEAVEKQKNSEEHLGSSDDQSKNRDEFGKIVTSMISELGDSAKEKIFVIDSDLAGSTGLHHIAKAHPEIYVNGGIMERGNYSACAGFGFEKGKQGIFATFSAFSEMIISEITMARLNGANVLAHFSHAGVDSIADNTCHFGMNIFFTDNGLEEQEGTMLYFPADKYQMKAILEKIFWDEGLRFVFSTRSAVPHILDENGNLKYEKYSFVPGKDEIIRKGTKGYVVSYGDVLYRALDAVERLRKEGVDVGLINKPTLNIVDEDMMKKVKEVDFILLVESQNYKTGLGSKFGTWLLQRGFKGKYDHMGITKHGLGGVFEQIPHQGLDSTSILKKLKTFL